MPKTTIRSTARANPQGPRSVAADRRTHVRLRDLCDEVLASYRAARGGALFSERDRAEAMALLPSIAPATHG